jgi:hypothetical protein
MSMPGFTAEDSLGEPSQSYRVLAFGASGSGAGYVPAQDDFAGMGEGDDFGEFEGEDAEMGDEDFGDEENGEFDDDMVEGGTVVGP